MKNERICKLEQLQDFVKEVIDFGKECRVYLLRGNLASGKTTFVQQFANVIGLKADVTSPTFSVQNNYDNKLYHYDIYQNGVKSFLSSGLLEELDKDGYHIIEWGDEKLENILKQYFVDYIVVDIRKNNENSRTYKVNKCIS